MESAIDSGFRRNDGKGNEGHLSAKKPFPAEHKSFVNSQLTIHNPNP
jgi:hypothetical protein